jgi:hypothetical protein
MRTNLVNKLAKRNLFAAFGGKKPSGCAIKARGSMLYFCLCLALALRQKLNKGHVCSF